MELQSAEWLVFLIPGFVSYVSLRFFLQSDEPLNIFPATMFSLGISLVIFGVLDFISVWGLFSTEIIDWKLILAAFVIYALVTVLLLLFLKKTLPWLEHKSQLFDSIKSSRADVLTDVLADKVLERKSVWLHIVTKDDTSYTGYIKRQGALYDGTPAIYIQSPKITTKNPKFNVKHLDGILIPLDNIQWVGVISSPAE